MTSHIQIAVAFVSSCKCPRAPGSHLLCIGFMALLGPSSTHPVCLSTLLVINIPVAGRDLALELLGILVPELSSLAVQRG